MIDTVEAVTQRVMSSIMLCSAPPGSETFYSMLEWSVKRALVGWLPPESVERLLKHQHEIIGAQVASLEKADLEIERLSVSHAAIERAALERAASKAASILEEDRKYSSSSVTIVGSIPREILALAPSNSTWREAPSTFAGFGKELSEETKQVLAAIDRATKIAP